MTTESNAGAPLSSQLGASTIEADLSDTADGVTSLISTDNVELPVELQSAFRIENVDASAERDQSVVKHTEGDSSSTHSRAEEERTMNDYNDANRNEYDFNMVTVTVQAKFKDVEEQSISSFQSQQDSEAVEDLREVRIRELTNLCEKQAKELCEIRARLEQCEEQTHQQVAMLNEEHKKHVEQMNRVYEDCRREKDAMVVKYAQAEQRCIEAQRTTERVEQRARDAQKNATTHEQRVKQLQTNQTKLQTLYDARGSELNALRTELERSRETVASTNGLLKSITGKFKEEQDTLLVTKQRLENAQKMVATQREQVALLTQKCEELATRDQSSVHAAAQDAANVSSILLKELDALKRATSSLRDENSKLREWEPRNEALRAENDKLLHRISELEADTRRLDADRAEFFRLYESESTARRESESRTCTAERVCDQLRERLAELATERTELVEKQVELLASVERANNCTATLSARNAELTTHLDAVMSEATRTAERCRLVELSSTQQRATLELELLNVRTQLATTSSALSNSEQQLVVLRKSHEDLLDEYAATRRKLEANLKDVSKQLERLKRKADALESAVASPNAGLTPDSQVSAAQPKRTGPGSGRRKPKAPTELASHDGDVPQVNFVDAVGGSVSTSGDSTPGSLPERMALIEKVVCLQNLHAAKIEKIEFYKDHVRQLSEELRKKSRLIQYYLLREEAGRLNAASAIPVDAQKAQSMAKKPGILNQLYTQATGGTLSQHGMLHLGEVNAKLQTLLEDTLVKNITLKDNLDTLSRELAHLAKENEEIKTSFKKYGNGQQLLQTGFENSIGSCKPVRLADSALSSNGATIVHSLQKKIGDHRSSAPAAAAPVSTGGGDGDNSNL